MDDLIFKLCNEPLFYANTDLLPVIEFIRYSLTKSSRKNIIKRSDEFKNIFYKNIKTNQQFLYLYLLSSYYTDFQLLTRPHVVSSSTITNLNKISDYNILFNVIKKLFSSLNPFKESLPIFSRLFKSEVLYIDEVNMKSHPFLSADEILTLRDLIHPL